MKDDRIYLQHIRDAIHNILEYTREGQEVFFRDRKTQDAVIRNLEIIGEASRRLSQGLQDAYPDIPWRKIGDMRNKLIHEYFGVNLELVWEAVDHYLPNLQRQIEKILDTYTSFKNLPNLGRISRENN